MKSKRNIYLISILIVILIIFEFVIYSGIIDSNKEIIRTENKKLSGRLAPAVMVNNYYVKNDGRGYSTTESMDDESFKINFIDLYVLKKKIDILKMYIVLYNIPEAETPCNDDSIVIEGTRYKVKSLPTKMYNDLVAQVKKY